MNEVLPRLVRCSCTAMQVQDFCPALAALVVPVENIFSLTVHYFNTFVPITQQASQGVVFVAWLLVYDSGVSGGPSLRIRYFLGAGRHLSFRYVWELLITPKKHSFGFILHLLSMFFSFKIVYMNVETLKLEAEEMLG
jgi:hypothetical protein